MSEFKQPNHSNEHPASQRLDLYPGQELLVDTENQHLLSAQESSERYGINAALIGEIELGSDESKLGLFSSYDTDGNKHVLLIDISHDQPNGYPVVLSSDKPIKLGRVPTSSEDVIGTDRLPGLLDEQVSRSHLSVELRNNMVVLKDLESTNGTSFNEGLMPTEQITSSDDITIPKEQLKDLIPNHQDEEHTSRNGAEDLVKSQIKELDEGKGQEVIASIKGEEISDQESDQDQTQEAEQRRQEIEKAERDIKEIFSSKDKILALLRREYDVFEDVDDKVLGYANNEILNLYNRFLELKGLTGAIEGSTEAIDDLEQKLDGMKFEVEETERAAVAMLELTHDYAKELREYMYVADQYRIDPEEAIYHVQRLIRFTESAIGSGVLRSIDQDVITRMRLVADEYLEEQELRNREVMRSVENVDYFDPEMMEEFANDLSMAGDTMPFRVELAEKFDEVERASARGNKLAYADELIGYARRAEYAILEFNPVEMIRELEYLNEQMRNVQRSLYDMESNHEVAMPRILKAAEINGLVGKAERYKEYAEQIHVFSRQLAEQL